MKITSLLRNKKRAISPVIAVILLIGLAVAASAAIFLIILPMLTPQTNLKILDAYVVYDSDYTKNLDQGEGFGKGVITVSNTGTGATEINAMRIYWGVSPDGPWTEITTNVYSFDNISNSNPLKIAPLTIDEDVTLRFPLPENNTDKALFYRLTLQTEEGVTLDTSLEEDAVSSSDMQLIKDQPDISFTGPLGTLRRGATENIISPTVDDNADIKNVTFEVSTNPTFSFINRSKVITDSTLWQWHWDTYNYTSEGLDNGSYNMRITVYDYAGLSASTYSAPGDELPLIIDNDYVNPKISSVIGSSPQNGIGIAEVGNSYEVSATITDSGSGDSTVVGAIIWYKLNETSNATLLPQAMVAPVTGDTWTGNIPGPFIGTNALAKNLTFWIEAVDKDDNQDISNNQFANVNDSIDPDFDAHTFFSSKEVSPRSIGSDPLLETLSAVYSDDSLDLTVTVSDHDQVAEVNLVWRQRNDTTLLVPDPWAVRVNSSGSGTTWEFSIPTVNVTVDGLEYYFNATDPTGNVAYEGSPTSPYRITIPDEAGPTVKIDSQIPSTITAGDNLLVRVTIDDHDLTFSKTSDETGTVEIGYEISADNFNYFSMTHSSGNSSQGQIAYWEGTNNAGNFSTSLTPTKVSIRATDNSGQISYKESVDFEVVAPGTPVLSADQTSVVVSGGSDHIVSFDVDNTGSGGASVTISDVAVILNDNTKDPWVGNPLLIEVNASGATNPTWTNSSNPSEGTNGTKVTLSNTFGIAQQSSTNIKLVFANDTTGFFDINDMTVNVTLYYLATHSNVSFTTPITTFQTYTEARYMRTSTHSINGLSTYQLDTTQSSSFLQDNQQTSRFSGSDDVIWGIRVWVRHSDTSENEVTSGQVATATRSSDGAGIFLPAPTWTPPLTSLVSTDAIVIRVYMQIGGQSYNPTVFVTEQLGASELVPAQWTVWYHTERDYRAWPQDRTRGIFSWGDASHDSRITNFQYKALGGGVPSPIQTKISDSSNPQSPLTTDFSAARLSEDRILNDGQTFLEALIAIGRSRSDLLHRNAFKMIQFFTYDS